MGVASSNPGKYKSSHSKRNHYAGKSTATAKGPPRSNWSQAHLVSSRPAAPSNLNLNRALITAAKTNNVARRPAYQDNMPSGSASYAVRAEKAAQHNSPIQPARTQMPKPTRNGIQNQQRFSNLECTVCGHTGHNPKRCFHRNQTCNICNRPGHLASVCTDKVHAPNSRYKLQRAF